MQRRLRELVGGVDLGARQSQVADDKVVTRLHRQVERRAILAVLNSDYRGLNFLGAWYEVKSAKKTEFWSVKMTYCGYPKFDQKQKFYTLKT